MVDSAREVDLVPMPAVKGTGFDPGLRGKLGSGGEVDRLGFRADIPINDKRGTPGKILDRTQCFRR